MLDNFTTLEDVKKRLIEGRSPVNFGSSETKSTLDKDSILINPIDFLEGAGDLAIDEYNYRYINDVDKLASLLGDFDFDFVDNSANHGGYLQREIALKVFKNDGTGERLAAFKVHTGLDIRAGYTGEVWILFDDDYSLCSFMDQRFSVAALVDDHLLYIDLAGFNEFASIYYDNDDNGAYLSDETCEFWACDSDELVDSVREILEEQGIPFNKIEKDVL